MAKKSLKNNVRPVTLLSSWLRARGIPFAQGLAAPTDLVVGIPPKQKCVHVTTGPQDPAELLPEPPGLNLNGACLCYGTQDQVVQEFWRLLAAIDVHEPVLPFNRGAFFEDREHRRVSRDRDGDELVFFRHTDLERSPDLTSQQVKDYENVVGMATKIYWKRNRQAMETLGYEYNEVLTFAWIWATCYAAHYEVQPPSGDKNQKLAFRYMTQQFYHLWRCWHLYQYASACGCDVLEPRPPEQKGKPTLKGRQYSDTGDVRLVRTTPDDLLASMGRSPFGSGRRRGSKGGQGSIIPDMAGLDIPESLRLPSAEAAGLDLQERLAALPHDDAVLRLRAACRAVTALEKSVRLLARRSLNAHIRACSVCKGKGVRIGTSSRGPGRGKSAADALARLP